ncbi:hypothetical protein WJX73_002686 [Symbiochloris irregularis]|uniref:Uncharacterized protein n=1 Tax=Symbiochloris irregularis TaxID=706552 RepID=A0AAW1P0N2_9CHLO
MAELQDLRARLASRQSFFGGSVSTRQVTTAPSWRPPSLAPEPPASVKDELAQPPPRNQQGPGHGPQPFSSATPPPRTTLVGHQPKSLPPPKLQTSQHLANKARLGRLTPAPKGKKGVVARKTAFAPMAVGGATRKDMANQALRQACAKHRPSGTPDRPVQLSHQPHAQQHHVGLPGSRLAPSKHLKAHSAGNVPAKHSNPERVHNALAQSAAARSLPAGTQTAVVHHRLQPFQIRK